MKNSCQWESFPSFIKIVFSDIEIQIICQGRRSEFESAGAN